MIDQTLHPALQHALASITQAAPEIAVQVQRGVDFLLEGVRHSAWPEVSWELSELTFDGFPIEFAFSSLDGSLRYTTDVGGPELPPHERFSTACHLLAHMGLLDRIPSELRSVFTSIQRGADLSWGAWIGGRHKPSLDMYKLYLDIGNVPSQAAAVFTEAYLGVLPLLVERSSRLRGLGWDLDKQLLECYFELEAGNLRRRDVEQLLGRVGLDSATESLFALISDLCERFFLTLLPGRVWGVSYTFDVDKQAIAACLFTFSKSLFGCDARTRERITAMQANKGWYLPAYEAISQPLAGRIDPYAVMYHGAIAFPVVRYSDPGLYISLRPPQASE